MLINNAMVRVLAENRQPMAGSDGKKPQNTSGVKVGETINATVVTTESADTLSVKTSDGKLLSLRLEGMAAEFKPGDAISFKISDQQGEEFNAKLIKAPDLDLKQLDKSVSDFLKSIGEKQTPQNKSILSRMLDFDMPANRDIFKALQGDLRFMQKISDILTGNPEMADDIDIKEDVAKVVIKLTDALKSMNANVNSQNTGVQKSLVSSGMDDIMQLLDKLDTQSGSTAQKPSIGSIGSGSSIEAGILKMLKQSGQVDAGKITDFSVKSDPGIDKLSGEVASTEDNVSSEKEGRIAQARLNNIEASKVSADKFVELINNQTIDKTIFLKKLNLSSSIFNMSSLDKLVFGKDSLLSQIQLLIRDMSDNSGNMNEGIRKDLLNILKSDISDIDKNMRSLKDMEIALNTLIKSTSATSDANMRILDDVRNLRDSYEFIKSMADNLAFVQIPLKNEGETNKLEIAYRKKKEREDDGYRIFVSLDTNNIGTVQSMVELNGKNLKIEFNVDDDLKPVFSAGFEELRIVLEEIVGDENAGVNVELGFFKRKKEMTAVDLFKSKLEKQTGFELQI